MGQIFSRMHATLQPALSVGRLVGPYFTFFYYFIFLTSLNGLVTSNIAPAHPHTTWVAVYPALFLQFEL